MRLPSYRHHKPSGQAFIELGGKRHYLGKHGSPESRQRYESALADWLANGRNRGVAHPPTSAHSAPSLTIAQMCSAFDDYAQTYYRKPDGSLTTEPANVKAACVPLRELFGTSDAAAFTPKSFKAMRDAMIRRGWSRSNINRQCARVKLVFKWAASEDLIPPSVHHGLSSVSGLRRGRCDVRESKPVKPVDPKHVEAILPRCSKQVRAMLRLQLLTAMRPGEVVSMRACDLNTSGKVWTYEPPQHKTAQYGHERRVYLGPQAQRIVKPFMRRKTTELLFTPQGNFRHRDGDTYTVSSYRIHIRRACKAANVPVFHPHQIRHTAATLIRKQHGLEAAQIILGHRTLQTTQVYAERDESKGIEVMSRVG